MHPVERILSETSHLAAIGERRMFESKGTKRTLASVFAVLACVADFIPAVAPFKEILIQIAGVLGIAGVGHATLAGKR
jgi:hypothetical protein